MPAAVRSAPQRFLLSHSAPTAIYSLSLHDALPIWAQAEREHDFGAVLREVRESLFGLRAKRRRSRSEEHTSELQSLRQLVCRLLLEKKNDAPREPERAASLGARDQSQAAATLHFVG